MSQKKKDQTIINSIREWIQDNFFGLIIFLVLLLIIGLIASLFIPINVSSFPENSIQLEKYNAAVEQRTIIIRSIGSIISGISVVIAFVSLLQSKKSELKKERLQVMPFPAYALSLDNVEYSEAAASKLVIKQELSYPDSIVQSKFDLTIKNIGLGSLVDFEIQEVHYEDVNGGVRDLDFSYKKNFILGKQETIRMAIDLTTGFRSKQIDEQKNMDMVTMVASFNDLLGHQYLQKFTVHSEIRATEYDNLELHEAKNKTVVIYTLNPKRISHTHPLEK